MKLPSSNNQETGRYRSVTGILRLACVSLSIFGVVTAIYYIFNLSIAGMMLMENGYFFLLLAVFIPPTFLLFPVKKGLPGDSIPWYDLLLALFALAAPFYLFLNAADMNNMGWESAPPLVPAIACVFVWGLVLESARRSIGTVFMVIILFFSVYPLFASYMPGPFQAKDYSLSRVIGSQIMGPDGLLGVPMKVTGRIVIGYLIFGVVMQVTGGARFFFSLAQGILGAVRGGPAKVAVITSAMFGSISGSAISNVVTTGSVTIPTMKRTGYPDYYAGAVEACASTGGVLMPPIMGASAFIMAEFLEITYPQIAIAAAIPSILYFFGLFVQVDGFAAKEGLKGLSRELLPPVWQTLKEGWFFLFAFLLLIYLVFWERWVSTAPFYASAVLLILSMTQRQTRLRLSSFGEFIDGIVRVMGDVVPALAGVGLIIGGLAITGAAHSFSREIIQLAGGSVIMLVILGAVTSFILGMGMSVTACYVFLALLLAPALIRAGLNPLASHLFILYCGMLSYITPPVAPASYVASGIAGAPPMKTAVRSMILGPVIYILPFAFIFNPAMVLEGPLPEIIRVTIMAALGVWILASSIQGYMLWLGRLPLPVCIPLFAAGLLLITPYLYADIAGIATAIITIGVHLSRRRNATRKTA